MNIVSKLTKLFGAKAPVSPNHLVVDPTQSPAAAPARLPVKEPSCLIKGIVKNMKEHPEDWIYAKDEDRYNVYCAIHKETGCAVGVSYGNST